MILRIKHLVLSAISLLLFIIIFGCGMVPDLKEGSESIHVRLPFVRILLDDTRSSLTVDSETPYSLECLRGEKSLVYHASYPVQIKKRGGELAVYLGSDMIGDNFNEIIVAPRGNSGFLEYDYRRYRGIFKMLPRGRNIQVINIVHMDDYLKGVVPHEIGFNKERDGEAIKAQAVAARTYAMAHLSQYADTPYDMKADISDQVYMGVNGEVDNISRAVDSTRGYIIKYRGNLINAYYHSTCGGFTDDIDEVWDKQAEPYLRAVEDSGYCSWSKYYNWKESYTARQLKLRIEEYLSSQRGRTIRIGDITDMYVRSLTAGGRVALLVVETTSGDYQFGRDKIRWVFTRSSNPELILQSARFSLNVQKDANGRLKRADFIGGGWGHGVGMCQCGAIGMSRAGWKFEDILTYYYHNTEILKLY